MSASFKHATEGFRSTDPKKSVKLWRNEGDEEPITIVELFHDIVKAHSDRPALVYKDLASNQWSSISYNEYQSRVEKVSKAFIKLGLEHRGTVAILASNCIEWFVAEIAAINAG